MLPALVLLLLLFDVLCAAMAAESGRSALAGWKSDVFTTADAAYGIADEPATRTSSTPLLLGRHSLRYPVLAVAASSMGGSVSAADGSLRSPSSTPERLGADIDLGMRRPQALPPAPVVAVAREGLDGPDTDCAGDEAWADAVLTLTSRPPCAARSAWLSTRSACGGSGGFPNAPAALPAAVAASPPLVVNSPAGDSAPELVAFITIDTMAGAERELSSSR